MSLLCPFRGHVLDVVRFIKNDVVPLESGTARIQTQRFRVCRHEAIRRQQDGRRTLSQLQVALSLSHSTIGGELEDVDRRHPLLQFVLPIGDQRCW